MPTQQQVFDSIATERQHQDLVWGPPCDRPHEVGAWLALMDVHLQRAKEHWASAPNDINALRCLRKVLAIGVACGEQHGLPVRPLDANRAALTRRVV